MFVIQPLLGLRWHTARTGIVVLLHFLMSVCVINVGRTIVCAARRLTRLFAKLDFAFRFDDAIDTGRFWQVIEAHFLVFTLFVDIVASRIRSLQFKCEFDWIFARVDVLHIAALTVWSLVTPRILNCSAISMKSTKSSLLMWTSPMYMKSKIARSTSLLTPLMKNTGCEQGFFYTFAILRLDRERRRTKCTHEWIEE